MKKILDACCGGRMFWFNKNHPNTLYVDRRVMQPTKVGHGVHQRIRSCVPDEVMDFRNLNLPDNTFSLVVFDPPHLFLGKNSHTAKVYGSLDKETWKEDLKAGFSECFRVLKQDGVLIFKWNEFNIPLKEVLELTPNEPLFGHKSGKAQKTHWVTFMKL
jgi:SAM-dependent methyltransferase